LLTLNVAHAGAQDNLRELYRDGRLGDNLPKLIVANIAQITPEMAKKMREHIEKEETGWFESHPADKDRIASAQMEQATGIFRLDWPATLLFSDFESLARNVTLDFYRTLFGDEFKLSQMHNTDEMLVRLGQDQEKNKALDRYFQDTLSLLRTLPLPAKPPAAPADPRQTLIVLKQSRQAMLENVETYLAAFKEYSAADRNLQQAKLALELFYAGIQPAAGDFKILVHSTTHCLRAREAAQVAQGKLDMRLGVLEQEQSQRLYAALELLFVPQVAARIEDAAGLQADVSKMYEAWIAVRRHTPDLIKLRDLHQAVGMLIGEVENGVRTNDLYSAIHGKLKELHGLIAELRSELLNIEYPFDHAQGATNIGRYCVEEMPTSEDVGALHNASGSLLDALPAILYRLAGRLASAAEKVETVVGLPQLTARPPEEEPAA
jgi:hypothetical protein